MAERTRGRRSQGRGALMAAALAVAAALPHAAQAQPGPAQPAAAQPASAQPAAAQAQPASAQVAPAKSPAPAAKSPARSPVGAARALAALARFANGQLGDAAYDRRVAAALGKLNGARATAKRIVAAYEAMTPADRAVVFPGVPDLDKITISPFDRARFDRYRADTLAAALKKSPPPANRTQLPPDPVNPGLKAQYELVYRGMKVTRGADADGVDEPVVFTAMFSSGTASEPYRMTARTLPETGTLGVANGASSGASAGAVWSSASWPAGVNTGVVLLTAVIEDNGDLAQRKQDLELLLELAKSEASEDDNPDRMFVLKRELEDALDLLHLANHQTWDSRAVQVRLLTAAEYDQLYSQPATAAPFPHKLEMNHNPRGADYTLYFDVPAPQVTYKTVVVTIKQLEALGPGRDGGENHLADFGIDVAINGATQASASRIFLADQNSLKPAWRFERRVVAGSNVGVKLHLWDLDPAPGTGCLETAGVFGGSCVDSCGGPSDPCPPARPEYDINQWEDTSIGLGVMYFRDVGAIFDLGSNTLSGDINGPAGTYTLTGSPGAPNQARIVVEIKQK